MAAPFTADHAMMLLDFSQKLDISLLETVINAFYNSVGPEVTERMLTPPTPLPQEGWQRKGSLGEVWHATFPPPIYGYSTDTCDLGTNSCMCETLMSMKLV